MSNLRDNKMGISDKEKMLQMVLSNNELQTTYRYNSADYDSLYDALNSDNAVVYTIAKIIDDLEGSDDPTIKKQVYKSIFRYLNENYY